MTKLKPSSILISFIAAMALLSLSCHAKKPNDLQRPDENTNQNTNSVVNNDNTNNGSTVDDGAVAGEVTPLPTKEILVANQKLIVEVADNDAARTQGLSDREKLDDGFGMLFDFTNTDFSKPGFWMKDMLISIDIIWIKDGKVVGIEANIPLPPEDKDLPVYYPPTEISHVLEVPAGWSAKSNLKIGDTVTL